MLLISSSLKLYLNLRNIKNFFLKKDAKQMKKFNSLKKPPLWLIISIFVVSTVIFFWGHLFGDFYFWEDFIEQVYPIQAFAANAFSNGEIPFWNPYAFCGMPFFADPQTGFFYPLNRLLSLFLDANGNLSAGGLQFIIILHFFIAQLCAFFLIAGFKRSWIAGVIGGVSYGFSFALVCHAIHPMIVYHLAWFPLVVLFFYRAVNEGDIKSAFWAALVLGLSLLAGHPQMALYEMLFLGILFLWVVIWNISKKENSKKIVKCVIGGLIPVILAVGIFAVQLLPSQNLADFSKRGESTYETATEGSLQFKQIYTAVVPKIFGFVDGSGDKSAPYYLEDAPYYYYWDTAFYFGVVTLVLGLFGAIKNRREKFPVFLIAVSIFGFLFALGDNFFLFKIFYNLPFFGALRMPARIMFFASLSLSILAGFGFDRLVELAKDKKTHRALLIAAGIPALIALLTTSGVLLFALDTPKEIIGDIQSFALLAFVFCVLAYIISVLIKKELLKALPGGAILAILIFVDLYVAGGDFNDSKVSPAKAYEISPQMKEIFTPNTPDELFRVSIRHYDPSYIAMKRNQGLTDGLMLIEGYNQLALEHIPPPCEVETIHNLYNVKYALNFDRRNRSFNFIERQNYFPRAWFVYDVINADEGEAKSVMENRRIDYRKTALVETAKSEMKLNIKAESEQNNGAECLKFENDYIKYRAYTEKPGLLVFSEIWYPAWKAYIDGEPAEIYKANYSFRAVAIPAGEHIVEMKYESEPFYAGAWVSIISLIIALGGGIAMAVRKGK